MLAAAALLSSVSASAQSERRPFLTSDVVLCHTFCQVLPLIFINLPGKGRRGGWGGEGGRGGRGDRDRESSWILLNVPSTEMDHIRQGERQTDRQADRQGQRNRQTDRDRETDTQRDRD